MDSEVALPTLLCSRPRIMAEPVKQRSRPVPVPLDALEEPPALRVKNTFLEVGTPQLPSPLVRRAVSTCPSRRVGCMAGLREEMAGNIEEPLESPTATPLAIETPCHMDTPLAGAALGPLNELPLAFPAWAPPPELHFSTAFPPPSSSSSSSAWPVEVHLQQQTCDLAITFPSYAPNTEMMVLPELPLGEAAAAPHFVAWRGAGAVAPRAVLSLADALDVGASVEDLLAAGLPNFSPADNVMSMLGTSSHPPPPPAGPALGTAELPSVGSGAHASGCCKPCAFLHSKGCENGLACKFCHLCGPDVRKRRRQEKHHERRELQKTKREEQKQSARAAK